MKEHNSAPSKTNSLHPSMLVRHVVQYTLAIKHTMLFSAYTEGRHHSDRRTVAIVIKETKNNSPEGFKFWSHFPNDLAAGLSGAHSLRELSVSYSNVQYLPLDHILREVRDGGEEGSQPRCADHWVCVWREERVRGCV